MRWRWQCLVFGPKEAGWPCLMLFCLKRDFGHLTQLTKFRRFEFRSKVHHLEMLVERSPTAARALEHVTALKLDKASSFGQASLECHLKRPE